MFPGNIRNFLLLFVNTTSNHLCSLIFFTLTALGMGLMSTFTLRISVL